MNAQTQIAERNAGAAAEVARREPQRTRRVALTPAVDIVEDTHGVTLWADLPGVPRENLDVRVHDGRLSIEAQAVVSTPDNLRPSHVELREPFFARAFTLSDEFDTSRIDANLQNGVLKLTIPRREEARPRRIEVRTQ
ncbi:MULTISPECIES: Hsp20/alpha crystallin family protein [unclassified Caballeronia]|uniref:Hsp20/alpha crystallin family protein n=1 Tax=unclassified Caballeronia TaxID=2646786 RepID=UPI00285DFE71|nr:MULTISPECIES: Hsp20/alpha crystallin family protein [unclassified Caballeronia]MDR5752966.1 Hsp20/alpha crystallin family protein [Caballeronia sp. LZ024]MDR5841253.1 Hsp20/alpha crystallin family protein [Caballeronia sp. LZ031]